MLSKQLKQMEIDKLINKKISKSENLNTEYSLTEFGKSTAPIVKSLIIWGSFNKRKITKIIDEDLGFKNVSVFKGGILQWLKEGRKLVSHKKDN